MDTISGPKAVNLNDIQRYDVLSVEYDGRHGVAVMEGGSDFAIFFSNLYKEEERIWEYDTLPDECVVMQPSLQDRKKAFDILYDKLSHVDAYDLDTSGVCTQALLPILTRRLDSEETAVLDTLLRYNQEYEEVIVDYQIMIDVRELNIERLQNEVAILKKKLAENSNS